MKAFGLLGSCLIVGLASCARSPAEMLSAAKGKVAATGQTQSGDKAMTEKATFGAGCFWHVEDSFRKVPGVVSATSGYEGGTKDNPSYQDVCTHRTGHAEVVEVEYDPAKVSYETLLDVFWSIHDPTTLNRQGPDVGTQYRSVVFYHSLEQKAAATASKEKLARSHKFKRPIVTQIVPAAVFWRAEEYHQRYLEKHGLDACPVQ
jgi:peptide-methionine (S)-S-oxide reductase